MKELACGSSVRGQAGDVHIPFTERRWRRLLAVLLGQGVSYKGSLGIRPAEPHTMHSLAPGLSVRSEKADSSVHIALLSSSLMVSPDIPNGRNRLSNP